MPPPLKTWGQAHLSTSEKCHAVIFLLWHNGKEEKEDGLLVHCLRELLWHWGK